MACTVQPLKIVHGRFALAHPLVDPDAGLAPDQHHMAATATSRNRRLEHQLQPLPQPIPVALDTKVGMSQDTGRSRTRCVRTISIVFANVSFVMQYDVSFVMQDIAYGAVRIHLKNSSTATIMGTCYNHSAFVWLHWLYTACRETHYGSQTSYTNSTAITQTPCCCRCRSCRALKALCPA